MRKLKSIRETYHKMWIFRMPSHTETSSVEIMTKLHFILLKSILSSFANARSLPTS